MHISLQFLSEFITLPGLKGSVDTWIDQKEPIERLADRLSAAGLEVESIDWHGFDIKRVVTGKINLIEKHPDADRLVVCQLDCGDYNKELEGQESIQIVTGATNIHEGDIVPVALHQSSLAGGFTIKRSKLRGVRSHGMLCSLKELGLADDAEGIWILPSDIAIGEDITSLAALNDCVFDIAILPNRGDTASYLGVAREISALYDRPLKQQACVEGLSETFEDTSLKSPIAIEVNSKDACPLYMGAYMTGLSSDVQSALWLQVFLYRSGTKSICLAVDITNYCCLALGSPLHAFDADDIKGKKVIIQRLQTSQKTKGLDDIERSLAKGDLCICDEKRVLALAGVMGSQAGSVTSKTQNIFLEAAFFDPSEVRKSASSYHLKTDSSFRFERAIDPEGVEFALKKALSLFVSLGAVTVAPILCMKDETQHCFKAHRIQADEAKMGSYTSLKLKEGLKPLERLGFRLQKGQVSVPSWRRFDCESWPDLAEELLRLEGFDGITEDMPEALMNLQEDEPIEVLKNQLMSIFVEAGFHQAISYSMIDTASCEWLALEAPIALENPMSPKQAVMRPALLPGLLQTLSYNIKRGFEQGGFVEEGLVFPQKDQQNHVLEAVGIGSLSRSYDQKNQLPQFSDFRFLKGLTEKIERTLRIRLGLNNQHLPAFLDSGALCVIGNQCAGVFGLIKPEIVKKFGMKQPVSYVSLSLQAFLEAPKEALRFRPFSSYPTIRCDLACLVPESLAFSDIEIVIKTHQDSLCQQFFLFDAYVGPNLDPGKKSLGIAFVYQSMEGTLTDEDVHPLHTKLCDQLKKNLPLEFR